MSLNILFIRGFQLFHEIVDDFLIALEEMPFYTELDNIQDSADWNLIVCRRTPVPVCQEDYGIYLCKTPWVHNTNKTQVLDLNELCMLVSQDKNSEQIVINGETHRNTSSLEEYLPPNFRFLHDNIVPQIYLDKHYTKQTVEANNILNLSFSSEEEDRKLAKDKTAKKRVIRKKDPNAPKKPRTAFMFYYQEKKSITSEQNPNLRAVEIKKMISKDWKEVSSDNREKYEKQAKRDKKRYEEEIKEYQSGH